MRIAIVDDIAQERALLRARLDEALMKHGVQAEIVEFERGEAFLQAASQQPFAVVFLDIFMGGTNGVEIAKQLREFDKDCMIAFSTTSTDYALEGFRVRATQYLVKPYTQKDIDDLLGEILPRLPKLDDSISLRVNGGDVQLCLNDMVYAEHFSHLIHVVTSFGRTLVTRQSMAAFMEPLKEDGRFFQCSRGVVVNMEHALDFDGTEFVLDNGDSIQVSREQRKAAQQAFMDFLFHQRRHR